MPNVKSKTTVRGVARLKKFREDQDETQDIPEEVVEHEFDLTPEQAEEVKKGKTVTIKNGKVELE